MHAVSRTNGSLFSGTPGNRPGYLGAVNIVGGPSYRQPFMSQAQETTIPTPQPPPATPPVGGAAGRAHAWGLLKKGETSDFMVMLSELEARLGELNMPRGIVTQVADRLQNFIETAPANATFELTDEEGNGLNAAIFAVETREAEQAGPGTLLMVLGAAAVATGLLVTGIIASGRDGR